MTVYLRRVCIVISLIIILVSSYIVQICSVSGDSMYPTLKNGDMVVIDKTRNEYERLDIVVVKSSSTLAIKRIIGLPGEKIKIENGQILINGQIIEDAVNCPTAPGIAVNTITLGESEYFLLGDNRENSKDSRSKDFGIKKEKDIIGKVIYPLCD